MKRTIFSLTFFALLTCSIPAFAQGSADSALDDAVQAAESAVGQSLLTSAVHTVRVLGMPEQLQAAVVEIAKRLENDRTADAENAEATTDASEATPESGSTDDLEVFDDEVFADGDSGSISDEAEAALASFDAARNGDGDKPSVDPTGRQGGDSVAEKSLDIERPEPNTPSRRADEAERHYDLGARAKSTGVARVVNDNRGDIQACYEKRLAEKPNLSGSVSLKFMINADGNVVAPIIEKSTLEDEAVESCITEAVQDWTFPEPVTGKRTTWTFPFEFNPGR